eukprot:9463691-Heterocapsa_arctica.AAC.1
MGKYREFEPTGMMHEQDEKTGEVRAHQNHYLVKLRPIAVDSIKHLANDADRVVRGPRGLRAAPEAECAGAQDAAHQGPEQARALLEADDVRA